MRHLTDIRSLPSPRLDLVRFARTFAPMIRFETDEREIPIGADIKLPQIGSKVGLNFSGLTVNQVIFDQRAQSQKKSYHSSEF